MLQLVLLKLQIKADIDLFFFILLRMNLSAVFVSLKKELKKYLKIGWQLYSFLTSEMCIFECLATEVYPQPRA